MTFYDNFGALKSPYCALRWLSRQNYPPLYQVVMKSFPEHCPSQESSPNSNRQQDKQLEFHWGVFEALSQFGEDLAGLVGALEGGLQVNGLAEGLPGQNIIPLAVVSHAQPVVVLGFGLTVIDTEKQLVHG